MSQRLDPSSFDAVADFAALFPVEVITSMLGVPAETGSDCGMARQGARAQRRHRHVGRGMDAVPWNPQLLLRIDSATPDRAAGRHDQPTHRGRRSSRTASHGDSTTSRSPGSALARRRGRRDGDKASWQCRRGLRRQPRAMAEAAGRPLQDTGGLRGVTALRRPVAVSIRTPTRDVTLHGGTIPKGDPVLLINGAASRDERFFPDADHFDIDRQRTVGYNLNFGYGIHSCPSHALSRNKRFDLRRRRGPFGRIR